MVKVDNSTKFKIIIILHIIYYIRIKINYINLLSDI